MTTRNPFLAKHSVTVTQTDGSTRVDDEDVREFTLVATDPTGPPDDAVENEIAIVSGQLAIYDGVSTWEPLTGFIGTGTHNAIARYDGTGEIQETGILVDDADAITGVTTLTIGNIVIDDTANTVVGVGSLTVDDVDIDGSTISVDTAATDMTLDVDDGDLILGDSTTGPFTLTQVCPVELGSYETVAAVAAGVAADPAYEVSLVTSDGDGADNITLANGTPGQMKYFIFVTEGAGGDTVVITPATKTGFATLTLTAVNDTCAVKYCDATKGWVIAAVTGSTAIA